MKNRKVSFSREVPFGNGDSGLDELEVFCDAMVITANSDMGKAEYEVDIISLHLEGDISVLDVIYKCCPNLQNYFEAEAVAEATEEME